jgi:hypothetical protein
MKKTLRKAKDDVSKTLHKAEQDARPTLHTIDDSLHDAEKSLRPTFHKIDDALHDAEKDLRPAVKKAGDDISDVAHKVEREVRHFIRDDKDDDNDDSDQKTKLMAIQQELEQQHTLTVCNNNNNANDNVFVPVVFAKPASTSQDDITAKNDAFKEYHFGQQNPKREENLKKFRDTSTESESDTIKKAIVRFATYSDSLEYDTPDAMEVDTVIQAMVREMEANKLRVN